LLLVAIIELFLTLKDANFNPRKANKSRLTVFLLGFSLCLSRPFPLYFADTPKKKKIFTFFFSISIPLPLFPSPFLFCLPFFYFKFGPSKQQLILVIQMESSILLCRLPCGGFHLFLDITAF